MDFDVDKASLAILNAFISCSAHASLSADDLPAVMDSSGERYFAHLGITLASTWYAPINDLSCFTVVGISQLANGAILC